jgi:thioredoxin-disulfide reductase
MTDTQNLYDVIIIGGGCAGLAAALYAKRYQLKTLVLAKELGGLITTTHIVENYPGILPVSGWDMMNVFLKQMEELEVEMKEIAVDAIRRVEGCEDGSCSHVFEVDAAGETYRAKTVIFGTGTKHRELGAPGEEAYKNKGVSYCATCDGALFKKKPLAVVGGGDSAAKEALLLSTYGTHVYVIARSTLRAEPINLHRIDHNDKITIIAGNEVASIEGDGKSVTHIMLKNEFDGGKKLNVQGLFIEIGHLPQNELAMPLGVAMNQKKEILIDRESRTNIPGFFSAGDCTDTAWKQAIVSASEGSQAANSAYEYITKQFVSPK